ncbi:MAG TPA: hypothetical protein VFB38_06995 [Chthonomonadaceae bacterium]|nr:hypothetical protein [Chthonomonadaceae bacterium]
MPRVKCPHCGAGNQDATEQDTCWQCGNVLGAPVARVARPSPISPGSLPDSGATRQLSSLEVPTGMRQSSGPSQRTLAILAGLVVLLVGIIIVVLLAVLGHR